MPSKIQGELKGLFTYPIKSARGIELQQAEVTAVGITQYDRHWMLLREQLGKAGDPFTQRDTKYVHLTQVRPVLHDDHLEVIVPGESNSLTVPFDNSGEMIIAKIWKDVGPVVNDGKAAEEFFSDYFGERVRLAHMSDDFVRERKPGYGRYGGADSAALTVFTTESLAQLNAWIRAGGGQEVEASAFRANMIVTAVNDKSAPFREDSWSETKIGSARVRWDKIVKRCPITQTNQTTGIRGREPMKTLLQYRQLADTPPDKAPEVAFAEKGSVVVLGEVSLGDLIEVETDKKPSRFLQFNLAP